MTKETVKNRMVIEGKIIVVDSWGEGNKKKYSHQMLLKSKDHFSQPSGIVVVSSRMMGAEGDLKSAEVEYSGFLKPIKYVDKQTGEQKQFKQLIAHFTEVIENA